MHYLLISYTGVILQLEEHDRSRIEGVKESERIRTMKELEQWKEQKRQEAEKEKLELVETYKSQKIKENQLEEAKHQNPIIFEDFVEEIDSCKITELDDVKSASTYLDFFECSFYNIEVVKVKEDLVKYFEQPKTEQP